MTNRRLLPVITLIVSVILFVGALVFALRPAGQQRAAAPTATVGAAANSTVAGTIVAVNQQGVATMTPAPAEPTETVAPVAAATVTTRPSVAPTVATRVASVVPTTPPTVAPPVAAESTPPTVAPPVAAESTPSTVAPPVAAESTPSTVAPPVAAEPTPTVGVSAGSLPPGITPAAPPPAGVPTAPPIAAVPPTPTTRPANVAPTTPPQQPAPQPTATKPPAAPAPPVTSGPPPRNVGVPVRVIVPSLGVDASVEHVGVDPDGNMATPDDPWNTGWYAPGSRPGQTGNSAIAGHVDYHGIGPVVFWDLNKIAVGAEVLVVTDSGQTLRFTVRGSEYYVPENAPLQEIFGQTNSVNLNLITCGGTFNPATRHYDQRLVIFTTYAGR